MITEEERQKAIALGAKIDSKFEAKLSKITKEVISLIDKSYAPNLITKKIREEISRSTFYIINRNNKYCLDIAAIMASAC